MPNFSDFNNHNVRKTFAQNSFSKVALFLAFIGLCILLLAFCTPEAPITAATPVATSDANTGGKLAYASSRDGNLEIYVTSVDGSNEYRLTNNSAKDYAPAWSPDGQYVAFTSNRDGPEGIYIMDADGTNVRMLTNKGRFPSWSSDGKQIAFDSTRDGNLEIYTVSVDGTNLRRLTDSLGDDLFPTWSPDGKYIAFTSLRGVSPEIYLLDLADLKVTQLTYAGEDWRPAWSPDGKRIAYQRFIPQEGWETLVMDIASLKGLCITCGQIDGRSPIWLAGGQMIAFISGDQICMVSAEGNHRRCLERKDKDIYLWSLSWTP